MSVSPPAAWLPALVAALAMAARALFGAATRVYYEDAFITLRYARNLAEGHGLVFNAGERVLGTTSPLFALLLAPLGGIAEGAWLRPASVVVGLACAGWVVLLWFRLARRAGLSDAVPLAAAALFTVSLELVEASLSGLETMLVVALMFAALTLAIEARDAAAGAVLALLVVARIDGVAWAALVLAFVAVERRRFPARALLAFAGAMAPWLLFASLYYGSPLPHTVAAKQVAYLPEPFAVRLLEQWALVHPFERHVPLLSRALDLAFVVGAVVAVRRQRALLVPAATCLVHVLALAAFAPHTAPWHVVPAGACFALVSGSGAVAILRWALDGPRANGAAVARALRLSVPAGLAVVALVAAGLRTVGAVGLIKRNAENDRAVPQAAGEWLRAHGHATASAFVEPIGFIGFHSRLYLWDTVGLVSPRLTEYRRRFPRDNRWYFESLRDLRPDFVVLRAFERPQNRMFLHEGPLLPAEALAWFDGHYRLERTFTPVHAGAHPLAIYRLSSRDRRDPGEKASKN